VADPRLLQRRGLIVLVGAEFIAMLLVVVYVGAVAVLFLFVVMMLDIDFAELRAGFMQYAPLGAAARDPGGRTGAGELAPGCGRRANWAMPIAAATPVDKPNIEAMGRCSIPNTCSCSRRRA
jgi:NADH-quinone oxidoreductase subunit J